MNDKEKLKVKKAVVTINTDVKKVVKTTPKTSKEVEKTIDEHLTENKNNTKIVIDWKNVSFYIVIIAIVTCLVLSVVYLYDRYSADYTNKHTTTTTLPITTTTTTTKIKYQTTTTTPTQATHTVFDKKKWE